MNYYPHHIGDFRSGTFNMTRQERWIYRDMIDVYYDTEGPFQDDLGEIYKMMGVRSDEDKELVAAILLLKFELRPTGYHHVRCDEEIAAYRAKAETAKNNGKKGGRPVKNNQEKPSGLSVGSNQVISGNPDETGSKANQKPITNNQNQEDKNIVADAPAGEAVPVVDGKKKAEPKFDPKAALLAEGVEPQQAADFLQIRKAKKAPLNLTALNGIKLEAEKAGMTLAGAVAVCCVRGWQGFKASWVVDEQRGRGAVAAKPSAYQVAHIDHSQTDRLMAEDNARRGTKILDDANLDF